MHTYSHIINIEKALKLHKCLIFLALFDDGTEQFFHQATFNTYQPMANKRPPPATRQICCKSGCAEEREFGYRKSIPNPYYGQGKGCPLYLVKDLQFFHKTNLSGGKWWTKTGRYLLLFI